MKAVLLGATATVQAFGRLCRKDFDFVLNNLLVAG
jgi:hypothetical protein